MFAQKSNYLSQQALEVAYKFLQKNQVKLPVSLGYYYKFLLALSDQENKVMASQLEKIYSQYIKKSQEEADKENLVHQFMQILLGILETEDIEVRKSMQKLFMKKMRNELLQSSLYQIRNRSA